MSQLKKTERLVRKYLENLQVRRDMEPDRRILQDSTKAMDEARGRCEAPARTGIRRVVMTHRTRRVAAVIVLTLLLAGAFSQARHVVSSSLLRLQEMILQIRTGAVTAEVPGPVAPSGETEELMPNPDPRAVMCAARFFEIAADDEAVGQALKEQGIELVQASASPETWYATLRREQAEAIESALTVESHTSPRVIVLEGEEAMIATEVFGLAWLPRVSNDEQQIESTFSFHDGQNGFEIPSVSVADGGAILIRAKGILPTGEDVLVLLEVRYAPES